MRRAGSSFFMPVTRRCIAWLIGAVLLLPLLAQAAASPTPTPFRIGVAPHSSARVILEMYQPLRLYLEQVLQRPVEIVTAPDFTEFARRGMAQNYDIAITTGHQARLLQTDAAVDHSAWHINLPSLWRLPPRLQYSSRSRGWEPILKQ